MELFIAWSGNSSKKIAEAFRDWIPKVLQSVKPYFSPADTEKGSRWNSEVSKKLEECKFGIICLTPDNSQNSWILFEAGALSNSSKSHVSPILFNIEAVQLPSPLGTFQATEFKEQDIKQLFFDINFYCGDHTLEDQVFNSVFTKWWPELDEKVQHILNDIGSGTKINPRNEREMIEEMLELVRALAFDRAPKVDEPVYYGKRYDEINANDKTVLDKYIKASYQDIKDQAKIKNEKASDVEQKIFEEISLIDDVRNASGGDKNLKIYIWDYLKTYPPLK